MSATAKKPSKQNKTSKKPKIPAPDSNYYHVIRKGETVRKIRKKSD